MKLLFNASKQNWDVYQNGRKVGEFFSPVAAILFMEHKSYDFDIKI